MDYLLLISSILAGVVTVLWLRLDDKRHLKLLNAFTGAYLLSLTFLHLLPELYEAEAGGHQHGLIGAFILGGFFVQIVLDSISMGVEHGHTHTHHTHEHEHLPIGVIIGLCLHAFIESLALGTPETSFNPESRRTLLLSIVVHNYPVTIALLGMLLHSGLRRGKALGIVGVFAAMAPAGMFLSGFFGGAQFTRFLMAIVIGIFMHIGTTILFESSDGHRFNRRKIFAIVLGIGLGVLSLQFQHPH